MRAIKVRRQRPVDWWEFWGGDGGDGRNWERSLLLMLTKRRDFLLRFGVGMEGYLSLGQER